MPREFRSMASDVDKQNNPPMHQQTGQLRRPRVVYWNNIPSPYVVDQLNALAKTGRYELEAWFFDRTHSDRSWKVDEAEWAFKYRYLPTTRLFGWTLHWPTPVLMRRPDLLMSGYAAPAWIAGWFILRMRGAKTCFQVEKTFDSWVKRSLFKQIIKRFLFQRVDLVSTTGADGKSFAVNSGAQPGKIHFLTYSMPGEFFNYDRTDVASERMYVRNAMKLRGTTFLYVGRLWKPKGVQYLLDAFAEFQSMTDSPSSLLLVGDGVDEAELREQCQARPIANVFFAGFVERSELRKYYFAADVFVFPTLGDPYGIVVDEAMACGLPVLSTSAAGEITARVEAGVNGYIVPPADAAALADRMLKLARDPALLKAMGEESRKKVANHTPERWAAEFQRMASSVLGLADA